MTTTFSDIGEVELIDHGRDDLTVVNAARVSNAKRVDRMVTKTSSVIVKNERKAQRMGLDDGLIRYLAEKNHWTPFGHVRRGYGMVIEEDFNWAEFVDWAGSVASEGFRWSVENGPDDSTLLRMHGSLWGWFKSTPPIGKDNARQILGHLAQKAPVSSAALDGRPAIQIVGEQGTGLVSELLPDALTFRIKAPIFVIRQWMRSNAGIVYNEVSRRYVDDTPEYHVPIEWRNRPAKGIKQGSGGPVDDVTRARSDERFSMAVAFSNEAYQDLLGLNIAPEQARAVLPLTMGTELWMTATHDAIRRILKLRLPGPDGHPQKEIVEAAEALVAELPVDFPRGSS